MCIEQVEKETEGGGGGGGGGCTIPRKISSRVTPGRKQSGDSILLPIIVLGAKITWFKEEEITVLLPKSLLAHRANSLEMAFSAKAVPGPEIGFPWRRVAHAWREGRQVVAGQPPTSVVCCGKKELVSEASLTQKKNTIKAKKNHKVRARVP